MFRRKKDDSVDRKTPDTSPPAVSGTGNEYSPLIRAYSSYEKRSQVASSAIMQPDTQRKSMIELQKVAMRSHGRPSDSYEGKKLIVGRDIELAGEITACERLRALSSGCGLLVSRIFGRWRRELAYQLFGIRLLREGHYIAMYFST